MTDQDASAQRTELEAAVATAEEEQRRVRRQAQDARERVAQLREQLACRPTAEFGDDGAARPKSEAAKLFAQLQVAEHPPVGWSRREQDAANRVQVAKRAVDTFTANSIVDLVKALEPEAHEIDSEIVATIGRLDSLILSRFKFEQKIAALLAPVQGLDARRELPNADHLGEFRRELRKLVADGLRPPLPLSICIPAGKLPPRVQTANGWVSRANAEVGEEQARRKQEHLDEQERRRRRRVQITGFDQPQPTGRSPLDETLDALLGDR